MNLKPWNDQNLKIEIKNAIDQYELIQANKKLQRKIVEKNEKLRSINLNLGAVVKERTKKLEIQNQALELSRAILEDLPIPIVGVSNEGMIVLLNQEVQSVETSGRPLEIGRNISDYLDDSLASIMSRVFNDNHRRT